MIITEIITINNKEFLHIYSNSNYDLERDGVIYEDVIDPLGSNRTYVEVPKEETKEVNEIDNEEISAEEFMTLLEEEL